MFTIEKETVNEAQKIEEKYCNHILYACVSVSLIVKCKLQNDLLQSQIFFTKLVR